MQSLPATSNTKKTTARSRDCPSDQLVKFKLGAIGKEDSASGPSSANQCNADDDGKQNSCPKDVMTKSVSEVEEDSSRLHNHSHDNPERACVASRRGSSYGYQAFASKIQPRQRRHKSLPDRIDERETKVIMIILKILVIRYNLLAFFVPASRVGRDRRPSDRGKIQTRCLSHDSSTSTTPCQVSKKENRAAIFFLLSFCNESMPDLFL